MKASWYPQSPKYSLCAWPIILSLFLPLHCTEKRIQRYVHVKLISYIIEVNDYDHDKLLFATYVVLIELQLRLEVQCLSNQH